MVVTFKAEDFFFFFPSSLSFICSLVLPPGLQICSHPIPPSKISVANKNDNYFMIAFSLFHQNPSGLKREYIFKSFFFELGSLLSKFNVLVGALFLHAGVILIDHYFIQIYW